MNIQALCEQKHNRSLKDKDAVISNLEETVANLQYEIKKVSEIYFVVIALYSLGQVGLNSGTIFGAKSLGVIIHLHFAFMHCNNNSPKQAARHQSAGQCATNLA